MKHRGKQRRYYRRLRNRQLLVAIGSMYIAAIHSAVNSLNNRGIDNMALYTKTSYPNFDTVDWILDNDDIKRIMEVKND